MRIDLSRIPRDRPCAIHMPTLMHGMVFLDEMKKHYPNAVKTWPDESYMAKRFEAGDVYYFPRLHDSLPYMTHGSKEVYIELGVALLPFDAIMLADIELDTTLGDMPIESLFG